jgi:hypothetical protein
MNYIFSLIQSSTGDMISLRVKSFLLAILPMAVAFGWIEKEQGEIGINLVGQFILAMQALIAVALHIEGWARRNYNKANNLGAFKKEKEEEEFEIK